MNDEPAIEGENRKYTWRAFIGFAIYALMNPAILFIAAGRLDWTMGWVFSAISFILTVSSRLALFRFNPDLIEERARYRESEGVKSWDKALVPIVGLYGPISMLIVAGLDKRFVWSSAFPLALQLAALGIAILAFVFSSWAMLENKYFSANVRIQDDRGHTVCTSGPYRYVRHPGYAGGILFYLLIPVILGSVWTFIPVGITVLMTGIRTALEDRTLQEELSGYEAYTRQVRYRLLPGIW
jgi:protein-S-isoprenylcysteine O-methyltransferase Ste14